MKTLSVCFSLLTFCVFLSSTACTSDASPPALDSLPASEAEEAAEPMAELSPTDISNTKAQKPNSEAQEILSATDEEVTDFAIADYKAFDPSGIVIPFEFDQAVLSVEGEAALQKIVAGMKKDILSKISVRGHSDLQGEERYNKGLSERRAKVIEQYLIKNGIEKDRLNPESLGESEPIAQGHTVAAFKKNRRGDFRINYGPSAFGKAP